MSDLVVDSSVIAKWILPEADSAQAHQLITQAAASGARLMALDLAFPEVANAIWKRHRQKLITRGEAGNFLAALARNPVRVEPAMRLLAPAFDIAVKYDRAVYDALFIALAKELGLRGVTPDEPLFNAVRADFRKSCFSAICDPPANPMKYAIIIPDGAADDPLKELGGKTPLEAALTPNMDRIAREGRLGLVRTVPDGFESGSDVATLCLLGYDPKIYHTGRAPLEAAAQRIPLSPTDWVFRCNLVTTAAGVMKDHSAGGISDAEAKTLIRDLERELNLSGFEFHTGVSYRNLLVYRGKEKFDVTTKPPHEIPEEPIAKWLPSGTGSPILRDIMDRSAKLFATHPINLARRKSGKREATQIWLWGQGHAANMPKFKDRFGINTGCMITGVDLLRGLAVLLGWDIHEVAGMTSFHDTNYAGQGRDTAAMLDKYDLVFSHIEAPDEASHQADWKTKVAAIEHIDKYVVGPVLEKLRTFKDWRILVMPDHPTNIATRKHGYSPTLFAMAGSGVTPMGAGGYSEPIAKSGGLFIEHGHELMEYFLKVARAASP